MPEFLLDTNVLSELSRSRPDATFVATVRHIRLDAMFLSDVVVAEIRFGIENTPNSVKRDSLLRWLQTEVRPAFLNRILPITEDILLRWRWIIETGRGVGYTFEQSDALLAATAAHHGLTMLSRDTEPFRRAGVEVLNPWRS